MNQGLYAKYRVEKVNGEPIDPDAQYFVLRIDTDVHARRAVDAYLHSVLKDNEQLAKDLAAWLLKTPLNQRKGVERWE